MNYIIKNTHYIKHSITWAKNNIKKIKSHKYPFKFLLHLIISKIVFVIGDILPFVLPLSLFKYRRHNYFLHYAPNQFSQVLYTYPDIVRHPDDEEFLRAYLKANDNYIDIGANIGTTTLCATTAIGPAGETISYEAHPVTFTYLTRSILNNKRLMPRVITRNIALGDSEGVIGFSTIKDHDDINHVISETTKEVAKKSTIKVPVKRLDDELTFNKINLIKIDVEGYELQVFNGARNTLAKTEAVFFEIYDKNAEMFDYNTKEVINLLSDVGFIIYRIDISNKILNKVNPKDYISSPECENMIAVRDETNLAERTGYVIM